MIHQGVSLYSYQVLYRDGALDMEGMIAEVAKLGCDGIELVPYMTPPCTYPDATDAEIGAWHELMAKYGTKPVCLDSMLMTESTDYETQRELIRRELLLCKKLGFTIMRYPMGPFNRGLRKDACESMLPLAEELGINMAQEIHAPFTIAGERVQSHLEFIHRTGTKFASLMPDMAIFASELPQRLINRTLKLGGDPELVRAIADAFAARVDMHAFAEQLRAEYPDMNEAEQYLLTHAVNNTPSTVEELREILPYVSNFHGKFYYIEEDYTNPGIAWDQVIPMLVQTGWEGYINSEYEGQRMYLPDEPSDEIEQVRRQHRMVDRLIGQAH